MIAQNKSSLTSFSRESSLVFEQIEELGQLKDPLEQESIKNDQTKLELENLCKNDLDRVKEMVLDKVRAEYRDELNNIKFSLDYLESFVDPSIIQAALSRGILNGTHLNTNHFVSTKKYQNSQPVSDAFLEHHHSADEIENMSSLTRRPNYDEDIVAGTGKVARPLPKSLTTHRVIVGKEMEPYIFYYNSIKVGCKVVLLCTELPKEVVAEGVIVGVDPKEEIDKIALGSEIFKVLIEMEKKPSYLLERPRKGKSTVREAVGQIVAWEIANVIEK